MSRFFAKLFDENTFLGTIFYAITMWIVIALALIVLAIFAAALPSGGSSGSGSYDPSYDTPDNGLCSGGMGC